MHSASRPRMRAPMRSAFGANCRPIALPVYGPRAHNESKAGASSPATSNPHCVRPRKSATTRSSAEPAARWFPKLLRTVRAPKESHGSSAELIPARSTHAIHFRPNAFSIETTLEASARRMKVISFKSTVLFKRGIWLSAAALLACVATPSILDGSLWRNPEPALFAMCVLGAFELYFFKRTQIYRLVDEVVDCEDHLEVRRGRTEEIIPFSNVS